MRQRLEHHPSGSQRSSYQRQAHPPPQPPPEVGSPQGQPRRRSQGAPQRRRVRARQPGCRAGNRRAGRRPRRGLPACPAGACWRRCTCGWGPTAPAATACKTSCRCALTLAHRMLQAFRPWEWVHACRLLTKMCHARPHHSVTRCVSCKLGCLDVDSTALQADPGTACGSELAALIGPSDPSAFRITLVDLAASHAPDSAAPRSAAVDPAAGEATSASAQQTERRLVKVWTDSTMPCERKCPFKPDESRMAGWGRLSIGSQTPAKNPPVSSSFALAMLPPRSCISSPNSAAMFARRRLQAACVLLLHSLAACARWLCRRAAAAACPKGCVGVRSLTSANRSCCKVLSSGSCACESGACAWHWCC